MATNINRHLPQNRLISVIFVYGTFNPPIKSKKYILPRSLITGKIFTSKCISQTDKNWLSQDFSLA